MKAKEVKELLKQWYNDPPMDMVLTIMNLINSTPDCDQCGCTEFLCGHNARG